MRRMKRKFYFFFVFFYFIAGEQASAQSLKDLEYFKRYDQIAMISMYLLSSSDCIGSCRDRAAVNAMRANILLGDNDGVLLVANLYESKGRDIEPSFQYKIRILKAYSLALMGDSNAYKSYARSLALADQDRLYRLIGVDVPFLTKEIPEPVNNSNLSETIISHEEKVAWEKYEQAPRKSPMVAGISNLFIPGAGYLYLGMWQTAALNAILTGLCIGSSIELFQRDQYFTGAAVATVGSVFYIGGALGAARSANDINRRNLKDISDQLRGILLPELRFEF